MKGGLVAKSLLLVRWSSIQYARDDEGAYFCINQDINQIGQNQTIYSINYDFLKMTIIYIVKSKQNKKIYSDGPLFSLEKFKITRPYIEVVFS